MLKVLLADDEPVILRGLRKLIPWDHYGLEIIGTVTNGVDLLKSTLENTPDIVISDICMPGMSGIDVIKHLNKSNRTTKFIFISAYSDTKIIDNAKENGAEAYLVKPIKKVELEKALSKTLLYLQESC
jgi:two-component system, response regulator YesN